MKKLLIVLAVLTAIAFISFQVLDEPRPVGTPGLEAEELADKVRDAIKLPAWKSIPIVGWTFKDSRHFVWDKVHHAAQVKWDGYEVAINLADQTGLAKKAGQELQGEAHDEALQKAWAYWCNDSFWLNAPAKIRDEGTTRSIVEIDNGRQALLVEYSSGGVTPGDAYLWVLGEDYLPEYFKMWVSIIPVGGTKATWKGWRSIDGTQISTLHSLGPVAIDITNLNTGSSPADFGLPVDYFSAFLPAGQAGAKN